jgi:molecular chaperone DnaJ
VSEAYETLIDPGRRRQYDAMGQRGEGPRETSSFMFAEFDFSVTRQGAQASTFTELFADVLHPVVSGQGRPEVGADLHASLTVTFAQAVQGAERQVLVTRQVHCGACGGAGQIQAAEGRCAPCQGTGHVRWARGHMVFSKPCGVCGGVGRQTSQRCGVCAGQGRGVRSEPVVVRVPPGITDGARVRVVERGHAGRHGGRPGDLYVAVHVESHPVFRRDGDDLVCVLPVAVHEAVLGARVDVPSLDGPLKLRIPPGTRAGQELRIPGRGLARPSGEHGDLVYHVVLVLPESLDERSRELMREFGRLNSVDVRANLKADS